MGGHASKGATYGIPPCGDNRRAGPPTEPVTVWPVMLPRLPLRCVLAATCAVLVLGSTTACGSQDEPADPPTVVTASPTEAAPTDEDAVADLVDRYYDALIVSQTEPTSDPALFEGIAKGSFVEIDLKNAAEYEEMGLRRVGRPTVGDPEITVRGASATAIVCWDERGWGAETESGPVDLPEVKPARHVLTVEETDGTWLITDQKGIRGAC